MPTPLRIALADDHELLLESLSAMFANTDDEVEVIWSARNGDEVLEKTRVQCPDVLLLDYQFKEKNLDGGTISHLLMQEFPDLGILILSVSHEITTIRDCLAKGAKGYATKEIGKNELLRGLRAVADGEYFLDQTSLKVVIHGSVIPGPKPPRGLLTPRELEVARPYAKGKATKEMASMLFISDDTVESHIKSIRSKTGCENRYCVEEWLKKHGLWEG
ncbi:MAG: response regulator transcription factor [Saprospiraceae bacterium]|nr:response regulator transcription factor [Saprospiraceae bacterium]